MAQDNSESPTYTMTQARTQDYWISPSALYIELNALGIPNFIQASCATGAQVLVYIKGIVSYDNGHNYRRWPLRAVPTMFNTNSEKYVYVAIPRNLDSNGAALVVFPSELIDLYGKNADGGQIGSEDKYYIYLQAKITSSGDNGTTAREWDGGKTVATGYLASDEAISAGLVDTVWYQYSTVDQTVTFLKDLTMKIGTKFRQIFVKALTVVSGGSITFENQGSVVGVANSATPVTAEDHIATPKYVGDNALSKNHDDSTPHALKVGSLTSDGEMTVRGDARLQGDTFFGTGSDKTNTPHVDGGSGDALLGDMVLKALQSKDFDALLQRGFGFTKGVNGKFTLSVTDLMVWGKAIFTELEIRKLSSVGGNVYLSGASSKIVYVKEEHIKGTFIGWRCYILADDGTTATQNGWRPFDQARCQTFNVAAGSYEGVGNRSYWRLVEGVSGENVTITDDEGNDLYNGKKFAWVVLSATDCEDVQTNDVPAAGDVIVLDGHRQFAEDDPRAMNNDASRTNIMMLQTTGSEGSVPNIISLHSIVDYKHSAANNKYSNTVFILSPEEVVFLSSRFKWISASGQPITLVNFRGAWDKNEVYYYYDQVSHKNAIWTCIVAEDSSTTEEPTDGSTVWRKDLTGGVPGEKGEKGDPGEKGDKGDPGKDGVDGTDGVDGANGYTVTATPSVITLGIRKVSDTEFAADVSKNNTSAIRVFKGNVDVTRKCRVTVSSTENCTATGPFENASGLVKVTRMSTYTADGVTYPFTTGSVTVAINTGSATLSHTIAVNVEMSTVWGGIETSVRGLKSEFGELQQDLQSEAPKVLTKYTSKIEQTAKSISAKVAQETVGRLNVLPGTAFNRETDVTQQRPDTFPCTILPLGGLEGTGAMVINQKGATDTTWSGLVWKGVVLKPKTYYTASVWARADGDLDDVMYLSIGQDTNFCYLNLATANEIHDWKMFKATFKTGDTEASCNNVRVELAVRKNGRGRCCKLMLDESNTYNGWTPASYADVSSRALEATGIDIKNKTIDMTADKFTLRNNHGEKSFGVDEDGNLEARSLKSVSKDGSLTAIIKDGAFTASSGLSGATAFFGLIDGMPYLQFTNAAGVVCYAIGPSGGQASGKVGVQMTTCGVGYSVSTMSLGGKSNYMISYSGSVTLQNFGFESAKIYQSKLQLVIDGFTRTLTASFKDSSFPMTEVGQGKVMTLMPGKLMQAEFEINITFETMPTTGSDGLMITIPSGARGCQLKLNGEVIGKGAINKLHESENEQEDKLKKQ